MGFASTVLAFAHLVLRGNPMLNPREDKPASFKKDLLGRLSFPRARFFFFFIDLPPFSNCGLSQKKNKRR
jgi:hypothetical protein